MNPFKEQLAWDIDNIFLNPEEHGETHLVNGEEMVVVIDPYKLSELKAKTQYAEELSTAEVLLFVRPNDLGYKPAHRSLFRLDQGVYRVLEVTGQMLYRIILEANG